MAQTPWTEMPWNVNPWTKTRVDTPSGGISISWGGNSDGGKREKEAEANARLIAEAPAMVAALAELHEAASILLSGCGLIRGKTAEDYYRYVHEGEHEDDLRRVVATAGAILARIKGEA